jgi:hypothetical protein
MLIGGPSFGVDGQPFVWDNSAPIQYRTDTGVLGAMNNQTANAHLQQALNTWSQLPTVSLTTQYAGPLLGVANGHVSTVADFNTVLGSCNSGQQSAVIYDSSGMLTALTGDESVVGFTMLCNLSPNGHIQSGLIVIGAPNGITSSQQDAIMLHETGHFFGLDHSGDGRYPCPINASDTTLQNAIASARPIMYYMLTSQTGLSADDKAWISTLYPSASYSSTYGLITGRVYFSDGQSQVQDVLVAAHPISSTSSAGEDRSIVISSISGYRFTGNLGQSYTADYLPCSPASDCPHGYYGNNLDGSKYGSHLSSLLGWYQIPVPAGSYAVEISSINYVGQSYSSIGPNNPIIPAPGPGEYWNAHESSTDPDFTNLDCTVPRQLTPVAVQAGSTTANIDFIMNGTAPTFDVFESSLLPLQGMLGQFAVISSSHQGIR